MSIIEQIVHTVLKNRRHRMGRDPSHADVAEVMESMARSTNQPPYASQEQMINAIGAAVRKYEAAAVCQNFPPEID